MRHATAKVPGLVTAARTSRIDDFVLITSKTTIGDFVHVGCHVSIVGGEASVALRDFSCLSAGVRVFSSTDAFDGSGYSNPNLPAAVRNVTNAPVVVEKFGLVGAGSIVLPGVTIGTGSAIAAGSLVKHDVPPWGLYGGNPLRLLKPRRKDVFLKWEARLYELRDTWLRTAPDLAWQEFLDRHPAPFE